MGIGRVIEKPKKPTKVQKETYWCEIKGSPLKPVPLKRSRVVKQEPKFRLNKKTGKMEERPVGIPFIRPDGQSTRHLTKSAKVSKDTGGVLQKGIQLYRLWFRYLKLALELEEIGVTTFVTKQGFGVTNYNITKEPNLPPNLVDGYKLKDTVRFKVKREKYEGWDLDDEVLRDPFDTWWKTHSHLFEGYPPSFTASSDNHDPNDFLFIRIDKSSNITDLREFITEEVKDRLIGKPKFQIDGYPRPDKFQNAYNALVYTLNPVVDGVEVNAEGFLTHKNIYLRATDSRSKGDRLVASSYTNKTTGKVKTQWGAVIERQRKVGIHHLLNVMNGRFGDLPEKGIK